MKKTQSSNSQNNIPARSSKRQGDWVCVFCSNLNYSFRDTCNRCKNITREENTTLAHNHKKQRNPLAQLSLNRHSSHKQDPERPLKQQPHFSIFNSQNTLKYRIIEPTTFPQQFIFVEPLADRKSCLVDNLRDSKGFSSLLFLTPTRYLKGKEEQEQNQQLGDGKSPMAGAASPLIGALKDQINCMV